MKHNKQKIDQPLPYLQSWIFIFEVKPVMTQGRAQGVVTLTSRLMERTTRFAAEGITLLLWTLRQVCDYEIKAHDILNRIK